MDIKNNISLRKYNTFGIDVAAAHFTAFSSVEELNESLEWSKKHLPETDSLLILGGGSNILPVNNINGLVIKNEIAGIEKTAEDDDSVLIKAGAGVNWHQFVLYCLQNNYAGVENLALIPGCVGASPMQNIGAYGVELKDVFHSLEAFHLKEKNSVIFHNADCGFGYRESVFKNKHKGEFVITSVTFRLKKIPDFKINYGAIKEELQKMNITSLNIQSIAEAVMNIRRSKLPDPAVIGNAGSFFKNPLISKEHFLKLKNSFPGMPGYELKNEFKIAAGWLIEQCGWKGYRQGDAGCHDKQALVLVNYANAKGSEIIELSNKITESVKVKFEIELETEVNII
ncbi:MAG: UDP-N-acetylmuramate dehydrogenase [Ferruginibacter sp.]